MPLEQDPNRIGRWLRLVGTLAVAAVVVGLLMTGLTPPGLAGEVLRHNRLEGIDASPLFYSEVEHMGRLEEGVRRMRLTAGTTRSLSSRPWCDEVTTLRRAAGE